MTSTLQQIKENADWVAKKFALESGLEAFANTAEAVDYLEQFLVRHEADVTATPLNINKYVHLFGSYLGECIIADYGGEWRESPDGMAVMMSTPTKVRCFHPFQKIYKRITEGAEHNLVNDFSRFIAELPT